MAGKQQVSLARRVKVIAGRAGEYKPIDTINWLDVTNTEGVSRKNGRQGFACHIVYLYRGGIWRTVGLARHVDYSLGANHIAGFFSKGQAYPASALLRDCKVGLVCTGGGSRVVHCDTSSLRERGGGKGVYGGSEEEESVG